MTLSPLPLLDTSHVIRHPPKPSNVSHDIPLPNVPMTMRIMTSCDQTPVQTKEPCRTTRLHQRINDSEDNLTSRIFFNEN